MTMSGSGRSSPVTPEMAVLQIQGILQLCISENKNSSIRELLIANEFFDKNFSHVLKQDNSRGPFSFDELKEYVLEILVPCFSETNSKTSEVVGKTHTSEKLKIAAESWPTRQHLTQINHSEKQIKHKLEVNLSEPYMGLYVSFENKTKKQQPLNQQSDHLIHPNQPSMEKRKQNKHH